MQLLAWMLCRSGAWTRRGFAFRLLAVLGCTGVAVVWTAAAAVAAPTWLGALDPSTSGAQIAGGDFAFDAGGDVTLAGVTTNADGQFIEVDTRPAGGAFARPHVLSDAGTGAVGPTVAMDPAGATVAVWTLYTDDSSSPGTSQGHVQAAVRSRVSDAWSPPMTLSAGTQQRPEPDEDAAGAYTTPPPKVAIDDEGDAIAVWVVPDGTGAILQASVLMAGSWTWQAPVDLSAVGETVFDPSVAMGSSGNAVVAWEQVPDNYYESGVYPTDVEAAALASVHGRWGAAVQLSPTGQDSDPTADPEVAVDPQGDATVVWAENSSLQSSERLAATGVWQPPVAIASDDAASPSLAVDQNGDAVVVWEDKQEPGAMVTIEASVRPAGSGSWQTPIDLSPGDRNEYFDLKVAVSAAGDAIATWGYDSLDGAVVYAATRPGATAAWQPAVALTPSTANDSAGGVALDGGGDGLAWWYQSAPFDIVQARAYDFAGPQLRELGVPLSGTAGTPIRFTVSPLDVWSGVSSVQWTFGDGHATTAPSVSHVYARAGTYQVQIIATDGDGNQTSQTSMITIGRQPPALSSLGVLSRTSAVRGQVLRGRCVAATSWRRGQRRCRRLVALRVSYRLTFEASTTFVVVRIAGGRRTGPRCSAPDRTNRHFPRCQRLLSVGPTVTRSGKPGLNHLILPASITRKLTTGRYRLLATPAADGQAGKRQSVDFRFFA